MNKFYDYQLMWSWVDKDENRRRIRFNTIRKIWQWVDTADTYHTAEDNTFSGAVLDAWWSEKNNE